MCKVYGGELSVDLLRDFLKLGPVGNWLTLSNRSGPDIPKSDTKLITHIEEMGFGSFMVEGVNGEFHFEPEGGVGEEEGSSPSTIYVNNETLVINVEPLNSVPPLQFAENTVDSNDAPLEKDVVILVGRTVADKVKNRKVSTSSKVAGKRKQTTESSGKETRQKARMVPPQASKASGDPSDPLDVDGDTDIRGKFLSPRASCFKTL
ncbi:hypothetical protein Tco_0538356 [Tanacetum coccineum]